MMMEKTDHSDMRELIHSLQMTRTPILLPLGGEIGVQWYPLTGAISPRITNAGC
jgi:hypothetical protein